jgi:hypothetical protein
MTCARRTCVFGRTPGEPPSAMPPGNLWSRHGKRTTAIWMNSDFRDLLRQFAEREVRYLIVGGYAAMHYSQPRFTKDLELWLEPSAENSARVMRAFETFGMPLIIRTDRHHRRETPTPRQNRHHPRLQRRPASETRRQRPPPRGPWRTTDGSGRAAGPTIPPLPAVLQRRLFFDRGVRN